MGAWLTATVKKPETWILPFVIIWLIGVALVIVLIYDSFGIAAAYIITLILFFIVGPIPIGIYLQRADLEKWVYDHLKFEWELIGKPLSTVPTHLRWVSLVVAAISPASIILLVLALGSTLLFLTLLWFSCDQDIIKFGESLNNYMSIILGLILMAQVWIVYQQYHHMKQPFFKAPLLWALSESNSDTDCGILLKNGGNFPIFNISYHISEVLVKDRWGYKGYKKVKSEEIFKDFLPRLDVGFEKEIFGKPTEEFKEMRLAVHINAKTLDGHSTRLLFYKAPEDVDFRLVGSVHT